MSNGRGCLVGRCDKPHEGHGFCSTHLARLKRGLDPHAFTSKEMTPLQRFRRDTDQNGGSPVAPWRWTEDMGECWIYSGSVRGEYGVMWADSGRVAAHVFSYLNLVGAYPDDLDLDHLCRNKMCVNPKHLEPVTPRENMRRMNEALGLGYFKEVCKNGHRYTDVGFYWIGKSCTMRQCKQCTRDRSAEYEASGKRPSRRLRVVNKAL